MSEISGSSSKHTHEQEMQILRELVLGDDGRYVATKIKTHSRELVSDVLSEALHDREKQDGSVNTVLLPLVEKSVEKSITNHSEQFVGYLYPLVGSLVRRSVTAFITEFLEKTNTLLENSFTLKGVKWRFKAWQSGVSFSQYVASQTFAFRVEQVLLIHSETGLLLNSVALNADANADADIVSSMLTAINDFVSDSFKPNYDANEQQLNVIRTNDFSLLIKQGPKAMIVAAITGNMPQRVANKLQQTLEEIHRLYDKELIQFNGDTAPFENSQNQLTECVISELKPEQKEKQKPWLAWILVALLLVGCSYLLGKRWQTYDLLERVTALDNEAGILITNISRSGLENVTLEVLRDPDAIPIASWFAKHEISQSNIEVKEKAYLSLEPQLMQIKVQQVVDQYTNISVSWSENIPAFEGAITFSDKRGFQKELGNIIGLNYDSSWLDSLHIKGAKNPTSNQDNVAKALLEFKVAKVNKIHITFEKGQSVLSPQANEILSDLKSQFSTLIDIAEKQNILLNLVIMGASDAAGSPSYNQKLSQQRADNVKNALQTLGIAESRMNSIGLGAVDLKVTKEEARSVLFNVVYFDPN